MMIRPHRPIVSVDKGEGKERNVEGLTSTLLLYQVKNWVFGLLRDPTGILCPFSRNWLCLLGGKDCNFQVFPNTLFQYIVLANTGGVKLQNIVLSGSSSKVQRFKSGPQLPT